MSLEKLKEEITKVLEDNSYYHSGYDTYGRANEYSYIHSDAHKEINKLFEKYQDKDAS